MLAEQLKNINPTDESWTATSRNPYGGLGEPKHPEKIQRGGHHYDKH